MMKQLKKRNILFLLTLIFLLASCQFSETPETSYADHEEVIASGSIDRGWIPEWLPETAVNIHEKHDIDTNASILTFATNTAYTVPIGCEPTSNPPTAAFEESWWPQAMETSWSLYECDDQDYLAITVTGTDVYFWRQ